MAHAGDDLPHPPGPEPTWGEAWTFQFAAGRDLAGWIRLVRWPNRRRAWYHTLLAGPGRPWVAVFDDAVPLPPSPSLLVRAPGLWADHVCETPLDHWTVTNECHAVALDTAGELFGRMFGDQVPVAVDVEFETAAEPTLTHGGGRLDVACSVHGEILLGDERFAVDDSGHRSHLWGDLSAWDRSTHAWFAGHTAVRLPA